MSKNIDLKTIIEKGNIETSITTFKFCLELTNTCNSVDLVHANIIHAIKESEKNLEILENE